MPTMTARAERTAIPTPGVEIVGLGHHAPDRVVTSAEIEARLGLAPGWIERRTGIRARRYAADGEALTDIAHPAAETALAAAATRARIARADIGLLMLATSTPDHLLPPSAPLLAHRLGLTRAGGIDLAGACSGFLTALALADGFVRTRRTSVLLVAANILSRRIDPDDRGSAVLFADAAGAVVLSPSARAGAGLRGLHLATSGADYGLIGISAGGSRRPFAADTAVVDTRMAMVDGRAVYAKAVAMMVDSGHAALAEAGLTPAEVTRFVPHQANARIMEAVRTGLAVPADRLSTTIADHGNSSAATIPFTLSHVTGVDGPLQPGATVLMTAAGAGLAGGAIVWGW